MDVGRIREDFPILRRTFHGKPLVYLDSAATSQKPSSVIEAERKFYSETNANVHRGVYALSEEATDAYEGAREKVARFIHAPESSEVVFVRGTTEAINLVASSLGRGTLEKGDRVVSTLLEHHSNIVPWHILRGHPGVDLVFADIDELGRIPLTEFDRLLTRRTKVVTLTHVSNVTGTITPVREVADRAHDVGALVVLDAAQSAPHRPIDVRALGVDFVAFSGHKMLGPTGIGVLWGREELLSRMPPYHGGGEMIQEVHTDRVSYREPPFRFEAGTPNIAGACGLAAAVDYLEGVGWESLADHSRTMIDHWQERCRELFGDRITTFGPTDPREREAVFSFSLERIHPHDVASLVDADAIAVRSGHHCAQPLMERFHVPALTRASPYLYNDVGDLDALTGSLTKVVELFDRAPASATA